MSSIGEEIDKNKRAILKKNRELQLVGIKDKEERIYELKKYNGKYAELLLHESIKGHTDTIGDLLKRVSKIWEENIRLKEMYGSSEAEAQRELTFELIYSRDGNVMIPTQKNSYKISRGDVRKGKKSRLYLPSTITDFRKTVELEWSRKFDTFPCIKYCHIDLLLYFGSFKETDADGKLTTIQDALTESTILLNDSWLNIGNINVNCIYKKGVSGFLIKIKEYDRDVFMKLRSVPKEAYNKKNIKW